MQRHGTPHLCGLFSPRAAAFFRRVMTALFAILSVVGVILLIGAVLVLQSVRPGFGQEPQAPYTLRPASAAHTAPVTSAVVALPPRSGV